MGSANDSIAAQTNINVLFSAALTLEALTLQDDYSLRFQSVQSQKISVKGYRNAA